MLEDRDIVALFLARDPNAIPALVKRYEGLCRRVAKNILGNDRDAEECVNDAYLAVWNTVPPQTPDPLRAYLLRIVRNLAVARYHTNTARKRNSCYDAALDELSDCLAATGTVDDAVDAAELADRLNRFLAGLDKESRILFARRYWYSDGIGELAERFGISPNHVSVRLSRLRRKLKRYLQKEGYQI